MSSAVVAGFASHFWDHAFIYGALLAVSALCVCLFLTETLLVYAKFCYACFFKPFTHVKTEDGEQLTGQQGALESFYKTQASIYDKTRGTLLRGREDMLQLSASQLSYRIREANRKPIWIDIGGGTGYNIEKMHSFVSIPDYFEAVFLVDLSPSLCDVARKRFARLGWNNVKVVCQDARSFNLQSPDAKELLGDDEANANIKADFISMSYSLSMIPDFYSVLDSMSDLLASTGLISCVDFYVQSASSYSLRTFTGGSHSRHVNWFSRFFWRNWFQFDRVHLDEGRRDYLEYRFGTILNVNARNYKLGAIPYYIWIGCQRDATHSCGALGREAAERIDAHATESPYLSPVAYNEKRTKARDAAAENTSLQLRSKGFEAAILNLSTNLPLPSFFYQNQRYRLYYDESLPKHKQFRNQYIYAFTWEDPREDQRLLNIGPDDVVFAITSAGDNVLAYALQRPRSIHAVDLNPTQNHLLELKIAAFRALSYEDTWKLFGEGKHPAFRQLLVSKLSPHLSSRAFQFWLDHTSTFTSGKGLYETGGTRIAVKFAKWMFKALGLSEQVKQFCQCKTLEEQREMWRKTFRPIMLSKRLSHLIVANEQFLWRALGVPANQRDMITFDAAVQKGTASANAKEAMWNYVVNTLDPVVENTLIAEDNYFYMLCLMGHYSKRCHPPYLSEEAHNNLSEPNAFDGLRIHTDEFVEVLARIKPQTVTVAVIMDHMDWFNTDGKDATREIRAVNSAMKIGGRVMLRSAGLRPWYISNFEEQGFRCERVATRLPGACVDRVNMYASTWICTKLREVAPPTPKMDKKSGALSEPVDPLEL